MIIYTYRKKKIYIYVCMHIYVGPALGGNPPNLWYPPRCGVGVGGGAVEAEVRIVVMIPVVLVLRSSNNGSKTTISSITTCGPYHWGGPLARKTGTYIHSTFFNGHPRFLIMFIWKTLQDIISC